MSRSNGRRCGRERASIDVAETSSGGIRHPVRSAAAESEIVTKPTDETGEERRSAMTFYLILVVLVLAALDLFILVERHL